MATRGLLVLLVLAYAAVGLLSGAWWDVPAEELLRRGAAYGPAIAAGERWRLAAAVFLHGGLLHLAFNLVALSDFGSLLERRFGPSRLLAVFAAAGVTGFLASTFWHPEDVSIGASGAIFGLLGWWVVAVWRFGEALPAAERRRRLLSLAVIVGGALGLGFLIPGVDNAAHLGGLLSGLALGPLATRRARALPYAALGIIAAAWAATLLLPDALAARHREALDFEARYAAFAQEDRAISRALLALGEDSRAGRLSDAEALARLERELIPRLSRQIVVLRTPTYATPRLVEVQQRWAHYARLRLEAVEAVRDAVTGRQPDGMRVFERKMAEAARIAGAPPATP